jgi:hypothetical protein
MSRATLALLATLWAGSARATEADCAHLQSARRTVTALEPDFVEKLYPPKLFLTGRPNPTAAAALQPVLEPILKKAAAGVPDLSLTLECRTWACRMLVLQPYRSDTAAWEKALTSVPELTGRLHGSGVATRRRTAETLGGQDLTEATVYFKLADRSG